MKKRKGRKGKEEKKRRKIKGAKSVKKLLIQKTHHTQFLRAIETLTFLLSML